MLEPLFLATGLFLATPAGPPALPAPGPSHDGVPTQGENDVSRALRLSTEEWLAHGRSSLEAGAVQEATAAFAQAAQLEPDSVRTRLWVLRGVMAEWRLNDALDGIDELAREVEGPEVDYLYGMAFGLKADEYLAQGVTDGAVGMHLADAVPFLERALAADRERFRDALPQLARSAWLAGELDIALRAARESLEFYGDDPRSHLQLGRVALSHYVSLREDEARAAEGEASWEQARTAFEEAVRRFGEPEDPAAQSGLAQAHLRLGDTLVWREDGALAQAAWSAGMAWDPTAPDYGQLFGLMDAASYAAALAEARTRFEARAGADDPRDATLLWWLGYSRFAAGDAQGSEEAFLRAFEEWPSYVDAWYWTGHARVARGDSTGAIAAFRRHWELDPASLVRTVQADLDRARLALGGLAGEAYSQGRFEEAVALANILAEAQPYDSVAWNNLGLFLRDQAEAATRASGETEASTALFERSLAAYERALELEPESPALLNDTAVILHYYLHRDLDRAARMYARSTERARTELTREDLDPNLAELFRIALRDSQNNLRLLESERGSR